jgi:hypothetical protein
MFYTEHVFYVKMFEMDIRIQPAIPERWDALAELFERPGPHGGTPFERRLVPVLACAREGL